MDNKPLLSVIIPVYNVEKYLSKCLDSVVQQTYQNLEIICIDDGSTDNSLKILEVYGKKDSRIKIVTQKNSGQSVARNYGIEISTGDCIAFLDSDDWLELDFYEKLIKRLETDNSDIAIGEAHYVYPNKISKVDWVNNFTFYKTTKDIIETIEEKQNIIYACACWNKVYKKDLIKNNRILFPENLLIEDVYFTFVVILLAQKISLVRNAILFYRQQEESTMAIAKKNRIPFDIFKIYDLCESFLITTTLNDDIKNEYRKILENFEIFNILGWYFSTHKQYQQEFFIQMQNKFKSLDIVPNQYVDVETIEKYKLVLKSKNAKDFFRKYNNPELSFMEKIFSVKNTRNKRHKLITVLGLGVKIKRREQHG